MSETTKPERAKPLETLSTEGRRLIGQAIIEGILKPRQIAFIDVSFDYNQSTGNYTQRGGGNYNQGGGNYNQAAARLGLGEEVINIVRQAK
jgi:hypothetical protein